jgi:hypothetical protein
VVKEMIKKEKSEYNNNGRMTDFAAEIVDGCELFKINDD